MADQKRLAFSIIQFLHTQLQSGSMSPDAQESLEGLWVKIWHNLGFFSLFLLPVLNLAAILGWIFSFGELNFSFWGLNFSFWVLNFSFWGGFFFPFGNGSFSFWGGFFLLGVEFFLLGVNFSFCSGFFLLGVNVS